MLKKVFILVVVAVFTASYAQAQVKFGARAGLNLSSFSIDAVDASFKPGFQIGIVAECSLNEAFAIQPGLLFSTQGAKLKEEMEDATLKETVNLNYLHLPVNAQYKFDLGGAKLLLQAGPYLGYGMGGKYKMEASSVSVSEDIKFGSGDDEDVLYMDNAFEFGLGLGAGVEFGHIQAGIGYNFGLTNLNDNKDESVKNRGLAVTVTYLFGK